MDMDMSMSAHEDADRLINIMISMKVILICLIYFNF